MKKIYVMAAFLGASSFAFNQVVQKAPSYVTKNTEKAISSNEGVVKAPGVSLWDSDFSDQSEWTIGGNGNQGAWQFGVEADLPNPNYYSTITSTTAANGFAFIDAVQFLLTGTVDVQNAWVQMAGSIDCTGENIVTLKFEQAYRAFNSDRTYAEVSLDGGTTWEQTIDVNPNITANTSATETTIYTNFDVNGSSDVKFRFRWENTNTSQTAGAGYAWQVDDVEVMTLADHDISVRNHTFGNAGLYYHQIPVHQLHPIEGSVGVLNQGSADQSNVKLTATEISAGNYTSSSAPVSLVTGASDSLVVANPFTPSNSGSYQIDYAITYDNADDVPSNNMMRSFKFTVGQHLYARDSSTRATVGNLYGQATGSRATPPEELIPGNAFDMFANKAITGIDFQFGDSIAVGELVYGEIYDANLDPIAGGETKPYMTVAGDERGYRTLVFDNPVNLVAGETYVVAVKCFDVRFSVATAGKSAPQTSFVYYPNDATWYYTTSTPVVRMNFDPTLAVENNELSNINVTQNFPNPFANETTVEFSLKEAAEVSYTVVDLNGKIMTSVVEGNTMAGDHQITIDGTSFANGVYYLNLKAGESSVTRKIIVNK